MGRFFALFNSMIEVKLKLQGNKMNFIKAQGIISSFIARFDLHKANINHQELSQFPNLNACSNANRLISEDKIHILQLRKEMKSRFQDLLEIQIPN